MSSIDYVAWEKKFIEQAVIVNKTSAKIQEAAVEEFKKRVEDRTPIGNPNLWNPPYWPHGYVPGDLKKSWRIDKDQARNPKGQYSSTNIIRTSGGVAINPIATFVVSNSQPYAERVETGWSHKQAPQGMMRITALEWSQIIEQVSRTHRK